MCRRIVCVSSRCKTFRVGYIPALVGFAAAFLLAGCNLWRPTLTVTVEANPVVGGTVEMHPAGDEFRVGDSLTVIAEPNDGFVFSGWTNGGKVVSKESLYILELSEDLELVANFDIESGSASQGSGWLLMVYIDGANNLEADALTDLNDMEYGLSQTDPREVKIVALIDRIGYADFYPEYRDDDDDSDGNWTGTRLYEVMPDVSDSPDKATREIKSKKLIGWDDRQGYDQEENMGDVETLTSFIQWTRETYPGYPNQALILWDHGAGMRSISADSGIDPREIGDDWEVDTVATPVERTLYLDEIQQAVSASYESGDRLTVLGMDACLMGTVEVAYEFRNLAEYMVFSPAVEWGGWYWSEVIAGINADTGGEDLVTRIAQLYKQKAQDLLLPSQGRLNSQTAVSTERLSALKTALDALASALHVGYADDKSAIHTIRDASLHYWEDEEDGYESIYYPYFELGNLLDGFINAEGISGNVAGKAETARAALSDVIVYSWAGEGVGGYEGYDIPYGLSIFFSRGDKTYDSHSHYAYQWWYTAESTSQIHAGQYYGNIDFADSDGNDNGDGQVETWRELMEAWYDPDNEFTPGTW